MQPTEPRKTQSEIPYTILRVMVGGYKGVCARIVVTVRMRAVGMLRIVQEESLGPHRAAVMCY